MAVSRVVQRGGAIYVEGNRFEHPALIPLVGKTIRCFVDLEGADAVCHSEGEFICNAQNQERWAEMTAQLKN